MSLKNKLLIGVPYRDREAHLKEFLPRMEIFLKKQEIEYDILIVEQTFDNSFNRAKLLNIAFDHTKGEYGWYCFHDVDMLPIRANYGKCEVPTHLASEAQQFSYKMPYPYYFGGVTLFDPESFIKINGYSNEYWGWGAEDDDVYFRCAKLGEKTARRAGRYSSLDHERKK